MFPGKRPGIGRDDKLIGLRRSPDTAKIKQKMLFASSKEALRRSLVGIAVEIQGTDSSEIAFEAGAYGCAASVVLRVRRELTRLFPVLDKANRGA